MKEFRQLTVDDAAEYHEVLIAGYVENKNTLYPLMPSTLAKKSLGVDLKISLYGLYVDGSFGMLYFIPYALDPKGYIRCRNPHICTLCDGL